MSDLTVRFATPEDAKPLTEWALSNKLVDIGDMKSATHEQNPTSVTLVIEKDGKVLLYAPFYCAMTLAFLAFNPEDSKLEKLEALEELKKGLSAFGQMHGVTELVTYSQEEYGVAKWAMQHGFVPEGRTAFKLKMNEV